MREFHQKNKKTPRAARTEKKEETCSSLCSSLEKRDAQALAVQRPPFVPPVTVSTSWP